MTFGQARSGYKSIWAEPPVRAGASGKCSLIGLQDRGKWGSSSERFPSLLSAEVSHHSPKLGMSPRLLSRG